MSRPMWWSQTIRCSGKTVASYALSMVQLVELWSLDPCHHLSCPALAADRCPVTWQLDWATLYSYEVMVMHLSIASPEVTPPPLEAMGDLTASLCPGAGNFTMRWVPGVGHIDRRQSVLWSSCAPLPDSMDRVVSRTGCCLPQGGAVWPFPQSPGWGFRMDLTPTLVKSSPSPRGGGGYPGACNWWCITRPSCDVTGQWSVSNCKTRLPIASVHSSKFDRKRHWMQRSGLSQPFVLFWSSYLGCLACVSMTVDTVLFAEQKRAWLPFSEEKCQRTVFHCNGLYWWTLGFAIETQNKRLKKKTAVFWSVSEKNEYGDAQFFSYLE